MFDWWKIWCARPWRFIPTKLADTQHCGIYFLHDLYVYIYMYLKNKKNNEAARNRRWAKLRVCGRQNAITGHYSPLIRFLYTRRFRSTFEIHFSRRSLWMIFRPLLQYIPIEYQINILFYINNLNYMVILDDPMYYSRQYRVHGRLHCTSIT